MPWVIDFDIKGLFDNIDYELMMKAVRKHTDSKWVTLYIERFLKAPIAMPDGTVQERNAGTPQGGVISPVLANLFMHYVFDWWMKRKHPQNPWERYADDAVIHCWTEEEAKALLVELNERMTECKLEVHINCLVAFVRSNQIYFITGRWGYARRLDNKSRMKGDFHVRFCEKPRVRFPGFTRLMRR